MSSASSTSSLMASRARKGPPGVAILECGHAVDERETYDNFLGEQRYCKFDGWQDIVDIRAKSFRSYCNRCKWVRRFGMSRKSAEHACVKHRALHPGHEPYVVFAADGPRPVRTKVENKWQQPLENFPEAPF